MSALDDIAAERRRQIEAEGWTTEHDDTHDKGEMAAAASMYALNTVAVHEGLRPSLTLAFRLFWPWWVNRDLSERRSDGPRWSIPEAQAWKPKDPRRDLVRAGALIVAEIERLDRAAAREAAPVGPGPGPSSADTVRDVIDLDVTGLTREEIEDIREHTRSKQPLPGTYPTPEHGWVCFHCGAVMRTMRGAALHFGKPLDDRPICCAAVADALAGNG
jgi:hypothetical protein